MGLGRVKRFGARYRAVALVAGLLVGGTILIFGVGQSLDLFLREVRDSLHPRTASRDIVVIEIDARSLQEINHWPWPRGIHGQLIDRLSAAHARAIAFDVDFSTPSTTADDAALTAALQRAHGSVILPTFRQVEGSGRADIFENAPIPQFRDHSFLASVNIQPDNDGMVRHYETGVVTGNAMRPSIAALLAEQSSIHAHSMTIDNSIDPASIPRVSYVDVLRGRFDLERFANKRILVGATAVEMGDRYTVARHGVLPGVIIQALAAETLLQGSNLASYGAVPMFLLALVFTYCSASRRRNLSRAAVLLLGMSVVLLVPLTLETLKLATLDVSAGLAALVASGSALLVISIQRAFWTNKTTDTATGLPNAFALAHREGGTGKRIVAAARIQHYGEISLLSEASMTAEWIQRIAERLALSSEHKAIYRIEDNALVWLLDADDTEFMADRFAALTAIFRAPIIVGNRALESSLSFGVAQGAGTDIRTLTTQALLAADRAAQQGIVWDMHSDVHGAEIDWKMALLGELDQALANGDLWVAYQPKADIESGKIVGAEALIRWQHPQRGFIAPDHFIPTIEKVGRMADPTLFVLDQVLATLVAWGAQGRRHSVAINISPSLLGDTTFFKKASQRIADAGVDRSRLIFEITESAALADPDRSIAAMAAWRALGIGLSIDDYGTGQSTLTYLKRLPATEIKIDKSFVTDLTMNRNDQILVRSTIALAHDLGFKVVAEGVENAECLSLLASYGCDTAQGWHIGKPVPIAAFNLMLEGLLPSPLAIAA